MDNNGNMKMDIKIKAYHKPSTQTCDVLLIDFVNRYVDVLPECELEGGNQVSWPFSEIIIYTAFQENETNQN